MASSSAGVDLGATSEWILVHTGHSRSHLSDIAVKQLVSNLCDVVSYLDMHPENRSQTVTSPPCELLLQVQELCVSIASHSETFPLIEALLLYCHKERWEFPGSGPYPTAPVSPLSQLFLQTVTRLLGENLALSYKSKAVLLLAYPPALHQELHTMAEECMRCCSDKAILTRINKCHSNLLRACVEHPKLYSSSKQILSETVEKEQERSRILYLFNKTVENYSTVCS